MYLLIIYLPLLSFLINIILGRYIGKEGSIIINRIISMILIIIIHIISYEIIWENTIIELNLETILYSTRIDNILSFKIDKINIYIIYLIIMISTIIINYSNWYLSSDPFIIKFISYLQIFTLMMLILVLSNNFFIMFIGWEGVGITSYLLINYWNNSLNSNLSSIKAVLYNKIGDIFFILAIYLFILFNDMIFSWDNLFLYNDVIIFGFIIAVIAKSAQFGLHNWLPDAMAGPTPVSALLHAATMVTAGIFLLLRILPIYPLQFWLSIIGIITLLLAGFIALFQNDIKKIIAYSTCSQIGYMFYSNSIGLYSNSYYHLFIHGYFKALLFITAGILIHSFNNNQDIRKFGGFIYNYPISYLYILIGTLSIISFPFLSGFYSKDSILELSYFYNIWLYILPLFGALLTTSYSFKLLYGIFFNKPKTYKLYSSSSHEPLLYSITFLLFGSLFFGYLFNQLFFNFHNVIHLDYEWLPFYIKLLPLILTIFGIIIGINIDKLFFYFNIKSSLKYNFFYSFFNNRAFLDLFYNIPLKFINYILYIDKGLLLSFNISKLIRNDIQYSNVNNKSINSFILIIPFILLLLFIFIL